MGQIESTLDELGKIVSQIETVAAQASADAVREILHLRERYTQEIGVLFQAVSTDIRLKENPDVAAQFAEKFREMRHYIANLQTRWRMEDIKLDPHGYLAEIRKIASISAEVRQWAKDRLAGLN